MAKMCKPSRAQQHGPENLLPDEEIIRRLKLIRHLPWKQRIGTGNQTATTISSIARQAGLTRVFLHYVMAGTRELGPTARRQLSQLFECKRSEQKRATECSSPAESSILPVFGVKKALDALR